MRNDELDAFFAPLSAFAVLILAVSGGADSVAMMHLVRRWLRLRARPPMQVVVATVDHGLRAGSRAEAEWVIGQAQALGFDTALLAWSGDKPATGLQDAAREARYRLLAELAAGFRSHGMVGVVTAHTEDDQAETLLMRLARGSGLDGLAAMATSRPLGDDRQMKLLRPLLAVSGARLRATLRAANATWIEDPSNDAERFERVRLRKARALLAGLGLSNDKIALSARRLARVRAALEAALGDLQRKARLDLHGGAFASFDRAAWLAAPEELRLRLLARLIASYGGQSEPLRLAQLEALVERVAQAGFEGATLAGAIVMSHGDDIRVWREAGREALPTLTLPPGASGVWDRRFRVGAAPDSPGPIEVRALGAQAFARLRQDFDTLRDLPAGAAATLPAFWHQEELIVVPRLAGLPGAPADWEAQRRLYSAEFLG
ncbi:MAG: tRNA lysidine(34) synthetase TilS [Hyphomicrobium sp.]|uniref:tRNA lysidine(34) synthetase TilS n=1 Tax=Hyphomicrobium sp. TaxID=82 RepID=UPI0025C4663C|nr:tRNA lysidine(34) synthetase TilS [Hyphomicrobium sp.]MBZ0210666.1 tRNA lysidine(34) synthetase TilS [Hyphomicrobium sp.]